MHKPVIITLHETVSCDLVDASDREYIYEGIMDCTQEVQRLTEIHSES